LCEWVVEAGKWWFLSEIGSAAEEWSGEFWFGNGEFAAYLVGGGGGAYLPMLL
jgi:hypothetical protein